MIKFAGKPSSDPIQEKLRQSKRNWNKQVSEFADNLFRLKDTMNGKPSKFYQDKSSIKEPIPADPISIIGILVGDFQEIAQKGNDIVRQQLDYSKVRRKKQNNQLIESPANKGITNLSKQLSATIEAYELISLGSNSLSRFFSRLLNTTIGNNPEARTKKYRMSLLKSITEIYKDLAKLEALIVKSSPDSIFASSRLLSKIDGNWTFFKTGVSVYKDSSLETIFDINNKKPTNKDNVIVDPPLINNDSTVKLRAEEILSDYKKYASNFIDIDLKKLTALIGKYRISGEDEKKEISKQMEIEYNNVLSILNIKNNTTGNSFREIWETKKSKAQYNVDKLESIGQHMIQRWIGRTKHKLSPFDKTSAYRLDIYKLADQSREIIDNIMDSLEKEMDINKLEELSDKINNNLKVMGYLMSGLESTLQGKGFDRSFMELLESGKITNLSPNLTLDQRNNLEKMIERRRIKELTDLYQGKK